MKSWLRVILGVVALSGWVRAAESKTLAFVDVSGASALPELRGYLKDADPAVRREAARLIVEAGTPASLDALVEASQDADAEVQTRALAGLVNFYVPGYANRGSVFGRAGHSLKGKFTDTNDMVMERYMVVRPEVLDAVTRLVASGANLDARAAAARGRRTSCPQPGARRTSARGSAGQGPVQSGRGSCVQRRRRNRDA